MSYYKVIDGQKYDAALLEKAESLTQGRGDGRISNEDARALFQDIKDGPGITAIERGTIIYLLNTFKWTEKAKEWVMKQLDISKEEVVQASEADPVVVEFARGFYEGEVQEYWQQRYNAYLNDEDFDVYAWEVYQVDREDSNHPGTIRDSVQFYVEQVENKDFGVVRLYKIPFDAEDLSGLEEVDELSLFVNQVLTDGDDGWIELFDGQGRALGYGRTYIELVAWGLKNTIRELVESGEFPAELNDREEKTLWGA